MSRVATGKSPFDELLSLCWKTTRRQLMAFYDLYREKQFSFAVWSGKTCRSSGKGKPAKLKRELKFIKKLIKCEVELPFLSLTSGMNVHLAKGNAWGVALWTAKATWINIDEWVRRLRKCRRGMLPEGSPRYLFTNLSFIVRHVGCEKDSLPDPQATCC